MLNSLEHEGIITPVSCVFNYSYRHLSTALFYYIPQREDLELKKGP